MASESEASFTSRHHGEVYGLAALHARDTAVDREDITHLLGVSTADARETVDLRLTPFADMPGQLI